MKRKLALLLAGSMVLSTVSTSTIFAASTGYTKLDVGTSTSGAAVYATSDDKMSLNPSTGKSLFEVITFSDTNGGSITSGNYYFVLENAAFAEGTSYGGGTAPQIMKGASVNVDNVTVSAGGANATVQVSAGATEAAKVGVPFKVLDASKPAYVTIKSPTNAAFSDGVKMQLTNVSASINEVAFSVVAPTQSNLTYSNQNGSVTVTGFNKNSLGSDVQYKIQLPSGFAWNVGAAVLTPSELDATVKGDGSITYAGRSAFTSNVITETDFEWTLEDSRTIYVQIPGGYEDIDSPIGSSFSITGLGVVNNSGNHNTTAPVTISAYSQSKTLDFAKFGSFTLKGSVSEVPTFPVQAGKDSSEENNTTGTAIVENGHLSAKIKITENIANSFRGGNFIVEVPEGVRITGLRAVNNTTASGYIGEYNLKDTDGGTTGDRNLFEQVGYDYRNANIVFGAFNSSDVDKKYSDNQIVFKNMIAIDNTIPFEIGFQLEYDADIDFEGDVIAKIVPDTNTVDVFEPITIGKIGAFESVISVESDVTTIKTGYTHEAVANIVITDKKADVAQVGETFTLELQDTYLSLLGNTKIAYAFSGGKVTVTSGNATVSGLNSSKLKQGILEYTVKEIKDDKVPVQVTISDITVVSDRNIPTFSEDAETVPFVITSTENIEREYEVDYLRFSAEDTNTSKTNANYNEDVTVGLGATQATLADGTKVDLYGASYISADGNTMMPVKGTGYALGLTPEDIVYDAEAKMATFFLLDGSIAQIQANNNYVTIDGVKIPLLDAKGNLVAPVIKDGRFYLPLRAAGKTVFGVETDFDAATKSVTLNPSK